MSPNKASLFSVQINPAHSKLRKKMSPGGASEGAALTAWTPIAAHISSHRLGGLDNLEIQNKSLGESHRSMDNGKEVWGSPEGLEEARGRGAQIRLI